MQPVLSQPSQLNTGVWNTLPTQSWTCGAHMLNPCRYADRIMCLGLRQFLYLVKLCPPQPPNWYNFYCRHPAHHLHRAFPKLEEELQQMLHWWSGFSSPRQQAPWEQDSVSLLSSPAHPGQTAQGLERVCAWERMLNVWPNEPADSSEHKARPVALMQWILGCLAADVCPN